MDRDAWIAYIEANSPLSPDFARRSVAAPAIGEVEAGSEITVDVSKLDLTSLSLIAPAPWRMIRARTSSVPSAASEPTMASAEPWTSALMMTGSSEIFLS